MDEKTRMVGNSKDEKKYSTTLIEFSLPCAGPLSKPFVEFTHLFFREPDGIGTSIIPVLQLE